MLLPGHRSLLILSRVDDVDDVTERQVNTHMQPDALEPHRLARTSRERQAAAPSYQTKC